MTRLPRFPRTSYTYLPRVVIGQVDTLRHAFVIGQSDNFGFGKHDITQLAAIELIGST